MFSDSDWPASSCPDLPLFVVLFIFISFLRFFLFVVFVCILFLTCCLMRILNKGTEFVRLSLLQILFRFVPLIKEGKHFGLASKKFTQVRELERKFEVEKELWNPNR